jgi:hypothetical protein
MIISFDDCKALNGKKQKIAQSAANTTLVPVHFSCIHFLPPETHYPAPSNQIDYSITGSL